jgi:hypothetical protein
VEKRKLQAAVLFVFTESFNDDETPDLASG